MKQEQKIERIRAKCQEILELGKLRTQGRWHGVDPTGDTQRNDSWLEISNDEKLNRASDHDYRFIASCAGAAEAMARSTLVALDGIQRLSEWKFQGWDGDQGIIGEADYVLDEILESWPDELL